MAPHQPPVDPLRYHGDLAAAGARLDFAVNVRGAAPGWLARELRAAVDGLAGYPDAALERRVREALGALHGRPAEEVLPLAGAAEGFALLPDLVPAGRPAAVLHPQFTEPEAALRAAGVPVRRILADAPRRLPDPDGPDLAGAALVVAGNPVNPTGALHPGARLRRLAGPDRLLLVDEAFADVVHPADHPGGAEPALAGVRDPRVVVLRSLTKTWGLAGLRCGYALGEPGVLARLARRRPAWPVGTLQLRAMAAVAARGPAELPAIRERLRAERAAMTARLTAAGWTAAPSAAPFLLARPPLAADPAADPAAAAAELDRLRAGLAARGIAVRRCDTFPGLAGGGLGGPWWRLAVRAAPEVGTLVDEVHQLARGSRPGRAGGEEPR